MLTGRRRRIAISTFITPLTFRPILQSAPLSFSPHPSMLPSANCYFAAAPLSRDGDHVCRSGRGEICLSRTILLFFNHTFDLRDNAGNIVKFFILQPQNPHPKLIKEKRPIIVIFFLAFMNFAVNLQTILTCCFSQPGLW